MQQVSMGSRTAPAKQPSVTTNNNGTQQQQQTPADVDGDLIHPDTSPSPTLNLLNAPEDGEEEDDQLDTDFVEEVVVV